MKTLFWLSFLATPILIVLGSTLLGYLIAKVADWGKQVTVALTLSGAVFGLLVIWFGLGFNAL